MSRKYISPPLVEAFCEFQFFSENWDWTIPGLIYQDIQGKFPQKRQLDRIEFGATTGPDQMNQQVKGSADRIQFLNNENTTLIQVGPDLLAINHFLPYPGWDNFRSLISDMFDVYQGIAKPTKIKRIGLRYINKIQIPEKSFHISSFLNLEPRLPIDTIQYKSVFMRVEIPFFSDAGLLILTFGSAEPDQPETSSFILDLDFVTTPDFFLQTNDPENWIGLAHNNIETMFEACVSDKLRLLFQEAKV